MQNAYRVADVRAAEERLMATLPDGALMQRAATGLATACIDLLHEVRGGVYGARVCLLIGGGNNGGDALWAGVRLAQRGAQVDAVFATEHPHPDALAAFARAGGRVEQEIDLDADLILDGLVGIGGQGPLREPAAHFAESILGASGLVIAVDLPSGVDADTGLVPGIAVHADVTVTFGCLKPGLLVMPALEFVGSLLVVDIGLDDHLENPAARVLDDMDVALCVPEPALSTYKYARGVVGIAAGSAQYPGAAVLCVDAARSMDVGMVEFLDRRDGAAALIHQEFPDVIRADTVTDPRVSAWGAGCGFIGDESDDETIAALLATDVPVVLDAGALTALARNAELRDQIRRREALTVLTPHDGEFDRLALGAPGDGRIAQTQTLAADLDCVVVRKGPGTIVATSSGVPIVDRMGSAALATAGSGDVLTGIIAGVCANRTLEPIGLVDIAAGVWLHGMAGALASSTSLPVNADDLLGELPTAIGVARRGGLS
jgi:ADP-dependent NAD(P)H-hydrate dehydratase / NAD(P)H-hydrate epimerase